MLYAINLIVLVIWMIYLISKKKLSWHSIVAAYVIALFIIDTLEVLFNLLLNLYKFPTHLISNPIYDNQLGIIFADTLILPFAYIILVYYNNKNHPWRITITFAVGFVILESIYLRLGYLQYNNWSLLYSAIAYLLAYRFGAYLAPRIAGYTTPVPYPVRLFCFVYTANMWIGATFGLPVLKWYQFKTGLFSNIMADDRFVDLYSGQALAAMCALLIPRIPQRVRLLSFVAIASAGTIFALYFYSKGWLIYHNWNHFLTILRYFVPFLLIMLYDRWEYNRAHS